MATYSKYVGTDHESVVSTLVLSDGAAQSYAFSENAVVTDLPNNDQKLIVPKSIRNSIVSLYESTTFTENLVGNTYYIGPSKSDLSVKKPYYLGNRSYRGVDLMDSNTLSNYDVLVGNTSTDNNSGLGSTVVSFLAGTNRPLYATAPRVDSRLVTNNDGTKRIDISLVSNGDVQVLSRLPQDNDPGGPVVVNGLRLPSVQESNPALGGSASDYKTLFLNSGGLYWGETTPVDPGFYGATGTTVPIFGSETYINGSPLFFTDARYCPIDLGDVALGETFDGVGISDVLERIVYAYLPPSCTIRLSDPSMEYAEIGSSTEVTLVYTVTKKSRDTKPTALTNMIPNQIPAIVSQTSQVVEGIARGIVVQPMEAKTTVFTISASDGTSTRSASASVTGILPFYYGLTSSSEYGASWLSTMEKVVAPKGNLNIDLYRHGIAANDGMYFLYDYGYGPLTSVIDPNGNEVLQNMDITASVVSSPEGFWASKLFRVYRLSNYYTGYVGASTVSTLFTFKF